MVQWCVSAYGMSNLHICEFTINAEIHNTSSSCRPDNIFFRDVSYSSMTMPSQTQHILQ